MAFQTYQSIREQLVTLSIEIDDRSKVCLALEEKVDEERTALARLEDDLKIEFNQKIESEINTHKDNMTKLMKMAADGMKAKKDLLEKCKELVEQVKQTEHEVALRLRKISGDVSAQLEAERRSFRAGQESRQRKFLADKLRECEEETLRALQPEFSRLRVSAEQDLADLAAKQAEDTRRAMADLKSLFASKLAAEEKHQREGQRMLARVRLDEAVQEAEQLEREQRRRLALATEELTKSLDSFRKQLSHKVKRERDDCAVELQESEQQYLDKMSGLRTRHEEDMRVLRSEHTKKVREIRDNLERKKRDYLEKSEGGGATSSREGECKLSEAEEDVLASLRRDLSKKRDSQLKSEIRRIETESALADKESRARVAEERSRAEEAMAAEERQLRRKQSTYTDQIAELSVQKNQLSGEINAVLDELTGLQEELSAVKLQHREAEGIQFKVKQKRQEIEDNHEEHKQRLAVTEKAKLQSLWSDINELTLSMTRGTKKHSAELHDLEAKHEAALNDLNAEIKSDIMRKDDELDCLRDAVQTEKVKMDRLKKLLAKYM